MLKRAVPLAFSQAETAATGKIQFDKKAITKAQFDRIVANAQGAVEKASSFPDKKPH